MLALCACAPAGGGATRDTSLNAPNSLSTPDTLTTSGEQALQQQNYADARRAFAQALALSRRQQQDATTAKLLTRLAQADEGLGDYRAEVAEAAESAALAQRVGDRRTEAEARNDVSFGQRQNDAYDAALAEATRALTLATELRDGALTARSLRNIGVAWLGKGRYDKAQISLDRSLSAARAAQSSDEQARTLTDIGLLQARRAQYGAALRSYQKSLALRQQSNDKTGIARVLGNICLSQILLNDLDEARQSCERSLQIARQIGDRSLEANNLNNLGDVDLRRGDYPNALQNYLQSVAVKRLNGDRAGEARGLGNLALVELRMERYDDAAADFRRSLALKEALGDQPGQSITHLNLAYLYLARQQRDEALAEFQTVLMLEGDAGRPEVMWRSFDGLSQLYATQSSAERALAIVFGKQAVSTIQSMRAADTALDQQLQTSFLSDKLSVYRRVASLLVDEGRFAGAQTILDMLKQQEFYDYVRGGAATDPRTARVNTSPQENQALAAYTAASKDLVQAAQEDSALQAKVRAGHASDAERQRLKQLDEKLQLARKQLIQLPANALAAAPSGGSAAQDTLAKGLLSVGASLEGWGHGAVLLTYFFAPDNRVRAFLSLPNSNVVVPPVLKEIDIDRAGLSALVFRFATAISDSHAKAPLPEAQQLYDLLIRKFEPELASAKAKTLLIYQDGILRYVPFAALYDGHQYLVQRFAFATYMTENQAGLSAQPVKAKWKAAVFGVSTKLGEFPALVNVPQEVDAIVGKPGSSQHGALHGERYMDGQFTQGRLQQTLAQKDHYAIVHIASHYVFSPGADSNSFLLLGDGHHLTLDDIVTGNFSFAAIDLLTLSACETARVRDDTGGREVEGLAGSVLTNGARAVMATLWPVADPSTALFMATFYRESVRAGQTKAAALQAAQLALLKNTSAGTGGKARGAINRSTAPQAAALNGPPYANPYYWAPFVLMGNWL